jgi:hypothetical protein
MRHSAEGVTSHINIQRRRMWRVRLQVLQLLETDLQTADAETVNQIVRKPTSHALPAINRPVAGKEEMK